MPIRKSAVRAVVAACLFAALAVDAGGQVDAKPPVRRPPVQQAISIQRHAKIRLQELIVAMHKVAADLEESDPETASVVAAAAQRAQQALIADEMEKVIALLRGGMVIPADATQAKVIFHLRQVLETLRGGADDLLARILLMKQMREMAARLKDIVRRQRVLERRSRVVAFGDKLLDGVGEAEKQVQAMVGLQADVQARTRQLSYNPVVQRLSVAHEAFRELLNNHEALVKQLVNPFPLPDEMVENMTMAKAARAETLKTRVAFKTLINSPPLSAEIGAARKEADAVVGMLGKMADELEQAAAALRKDDLGEAQTAVGEAGVDLLEAIKFLGRMAVRIAGDPKAVEAMAAQEKLVELVGRLPNVEEALLLAEEEPPAEGESDPVPPAGGHARPAGEAATPLVMSLRTQMREAAEALGLGDKQAAVERQGLVVASLKQTLQQIEEGRRVIADLRRAPDYPQQQKQQKRIAVDILRAAAPSPTSQPAGQPTSAPATQPSLEPPPMPAAPSPLMGEMILSVIRAGGLAEKAARFLGDRNAPEANGVQNEVIRLLESIIDQLEAEVLGAAPVLLEELKGFAFGILERLAAIQKAVLADTIALWEKRKPDGTFERPYLLRFAALAKLERQIIVGLDEMERLEKEYEESETTMPILPGVFRFVLKLVRKDVPVVVDRLSKYDGGPRTQQMEKDILDRLQGILDAIQSSEAAPQPPHDSSQHVWASKFGTAVTRTDTIQMLIVLQREINRRTADLQKQMAAGAGSPAELGAAFAELREQQAEVKKTIAEMVGEDLQAENPSPRR